MRLFYVNVINLDQVQLFNSYTMQLSAQYLHYD